MTEEDYKLVSSIIDSLSLISRVSRHAWFRFAYFGNNDELRKNVRYLIQERILCCEEHGKLIDAGRLEELVSRFIKEVHLPNVNNQQVNAARDEPSGLIYTLLGDWNGAMEEACKHEVYDEDDKEWVSTITMTFIEDKQWSTCTQCGASFLPGALEDRKVTDKNETLE